MYKILPIYGLLGIDWGRIDNYFKKYDNFTVLRFNKSGDYEQYLNENDGLVGVYICIIENLETAYINRELLNGSVVIYSKPENAFRNLLSLTSLSFDDIFTVFTKWGKTAQEALDLSMSGDFDINLIGEEAFKSNNQNLSKFILNVTEGDLKQTLDDFEPMSIDFLAECVVPLGAYLLREHWGFYTAYRSLQDAAYIPEFEEKRFFSPVELVKSSLQKLYKFANELNVDAKQTVNFDLEFNQLEIIKSIIFDHRVELTKQFIHIDDVPIDVVVKNLIDVISDGSLAVSNLTNKLHVANLNLSVSNENSVYLMSMLENYRNNYALEKIKNDEFLADVEKYEVDMELLRSDQEKEVEFYKRKLLTFEKFLSEKIELWNNFNLTLLPNDNTKVVSHDSMLKCLCDSVFIIGRYESDGYENITVKLKKIILPDSRELSEIIFKLVYIYGRVLIELRDLPGQEEFINWDCSQLDEFGRFFLYDPAEYVNGLNSIGFSDRVLFESIIVLLFNCFRKNRVYTSDGLDDCNIRLWKLRSSILYNNLVDCKEEVGYSAVSLLEHYNEDCYEHLWIVLNQVYWKVGVFHAVNFKISFGRGRFKRRLLNQDLILLEFREQSAISELFGFWPPKNADQYGVKFELKIVKSREGIVVISDEFLCKFEQKFIISIMRSLINAIHTLSTNSEISVSMANEWIERLKKFSLSQSKYSFRYSE